MISFFHDRPWLVGLVAATAIGTGVAMSRGVEDARTTEFVPLSSGKRVIANRLPPTWRSHVRIDKTRTVSNKVVADLPTSGGTAELTLDPTLQAQAAKILKTYDVPYAGMTLIDLKSGETKALVGHSSYDRKLSSEDLTLKPWAPAASVFKLVTSVALIQRGVPATASVCFHGGRRGIRRSHLVDNPDRDATCRTLSQGLAQSLNPLFAKLALRYLPGNTLQSVADELGFNRPVPFDLPVQPSTARIPHSKLEKARTAAGFWHSELSVLHGATLAAVAATGGQLAWPHIVRHVKLKNGKRITPKRAEPKRVLDLKQARTLAGMMRETVSNGSGYRGFHTRSGRPYLRGISVAGKTGSLSRKDPYLQYSWFVGFAPADKPEVAFAVLLGNPPKWRIKASAAARMLLGHYFKNKAKRAKTAARALKRRKPNKAS